LLAANPDGIGDIFEASCELEELEMVEVGSIAELEDDDVEKLELEESVLLGVCSLEEVDDNDNETLETVESAGSVGLSVVVTDAVVGSTGMMVRTSGIEDKLVDSETRVVFENGTVLAKLLSSALRLWIG